MIKEKLIEKFGSDINHMSCVYLNDGEGVIRRLTKKIIPKREVLEIGTYRGVSACVLSTIFENVITVDIKDEPMRKEIMATTDNVEFVKVKNRTNEIAVVIDIFKNHNIDMVFLDGEHFNGELAKDWEMVKDYCPNILIHDYSPSFSEVYDFVNEKKGYKLYKEGTFALLIRDAEPTSDGLNPDSNQKATPPAKKPKKKRLFTKRKKSK